MPRLLTAAAPARASLALAVVALWASGGACVGHVGDTSRADRVEPDDPPGASGGPAGGGSGADAPSCVAVTPAIALAFDGSDDHVETGDSPALALSELTIEAWIRREGYGQPTGSGSFSVVPIAGKGSCKNDSGTVDCNYALGLRGDLLFADFEELGDGTNHPVAGKVVIPWGQWHHVAATYDGTWRLYVDGKLDTESVVDAPPQVDSTLPFAIGTAFDVAGTAEGRFHGSIAEVRVWDHARDAAEIFGSMYAALSAAEGLVGRFALDASGRGDDAAGIVVGASHDPDGPPVGDGALPTIVAVAPEAHASIGEGSVELAVDVADPDGEPTKVTFHVREVTDGDDFAIVVLPDTQYYTDVSRSTAHFFNEQTAWVAANREALNIVAVIHNGDIVEHGNRDEGAWVRTDTAMKKLEAPVDGLPHGLPYSMCVGNHDQDPAGTPGGTESYNDWFGIGRFHAREYWGGSYGGKHDESWVSFDAGGLRLIVVNLQFRKQNDPAVLEWMRSIFEANPDAFGIVNSHYIMNQHGDFSAQGAGFYEALKDVPSVRLMTCGHVCIGGDGESRRTDAFEGHTIHSMLADYQCIGYAPPPGGGGQGYLRIWQFSPKRAELLVRTYSPSLDVSQTSADAEFTLPVDLPGAGSPLEKLASVDVVDGAAAAELTGLEPGATYEWTATVRDCTHSVTTPIQRFTTR